MPQSQNSKNQGGNPGGNHLVEEVASSPKDDGMRSSTRSNDRVWECS